MPQGLLPYYISPNDGRLLNNHITFGAMGDSYYEYLLKVRLTDAAVYITLSAICREEECAVFAIHAANLPRCASVHDVRRKQALMCSCRTWQVWLLKGKKDDMYRAMWEKAMDDTAAQLIFSKGNLTYIAELQRCAPAIMALPACMNVPNALPFPLSSCCQAV